MPSTRDAKTIGTTETAHRSIAVLRAAFTVHPRVMSVDDSHPPNTLPASDTRYTTTTGGPISSSDSPNLRLKKSGIQNRYSHQIGSVMNFAVAMVHVCRCGSSVFQETWAIGSGGSLKMYARSAAPRRAC